MEAPTRRVSVVRRTLGLIATVSTVALAIGLTALGSGAISARAVPAEVESDDVQPLAVRILEVEEQSGYEVTSRYIGRIEARRDAAIGFEAGGTIQTVLVEEGQQVTKGEVLARLDTAALEAERDVQVAARDALLASLELAELTAGRQKELLDRSFASEATYDQARLSLAQIQAEPKRADAGIRAVDVALAKSVIEAPFDGRVGAVLADDGTRAGPGQAVIEVFEAGAPLVRVGLPEGAAASLKIGDALNATFGAQSFEAQVTSIRPDVAAATRTVAVLLEVAGADHFAEGTLGHVEITRKVPGEGAWMPITALSEGVRGLWTVFLVEETGTGQVARRDAVELVHAGADRVFVNGAFDGPVRVIASGTHRLADGQRVVAE